MMIVGVGVLALFDIFIFLYKARGTHQPAYKAAPGTYKQIVRVRVLTSACRAYRQRQVSHIEAHYQLG